MVEKRAVDMALEAAVNVELADRFAELFGGRGIEIPVELLRLLDKGDFVSLGIGRKTPFWRYFTVPSGWWHSYNLWGVAFPKEKELVFRQIDGVADLIELHGSISFAHREWVAVCKALAEQISTIPGWVVSESFLNALSTGEVTTLDEINKHWVTYYEEKAQKAQAQEAQRQLADLQSFLSAWVGKVPALKSIADAEALANNLVGGKADAYDLQPALRQIFDASPLAEVPKIANWRQYMPRWPVFLDVEDVLVYRVGSITVWSTEGEREAAELELPALSFRG